MIDPIREAYEKEENVVKCIETWSLVFDEQRNKYVPMLTPDAKMQLCDQLTNTLDFYRKGWQAGRKEPVALPELDRDLALTLLCQSDMSEDDWCFAAQVWDELKPKINTFLLAQGYTLEET